MARKTVLLVEGADDEHVVKNICGVLNLGEIGKIIAKQGKPALLNDIPVHVKESEIAAFGIVVDADADCQSAWDAIAHQLKKAGYAKVPRRAASGGTIIEAAPEKLLPRVGVWLMPDNEDAGILEDFLRSLIPLDDALLACAQSSIAGLPERRFTPAVAPKALLHTWLAWQEEPGRPFGQAIAARYLVADLPASAAFAGWLKKTFFDCA